jgi:hypothetical protein
MPFKSRVDNFAMHSETFSALKRDRNTNSDMPEMPGQPRSSAVRKTGVRN